MLRCRWSLIAGRLPGRTDNEIKNYWNTHIKRKLISRGVDPQTHRPLKEIATNAAASQLDFRNSSPPSFPVAGISLVNQRNNDSTSTTQYNSATLKPKTESVEDGNCTSSGTTTEEEPPQLQLQRQQVMCEISELNLELSVGLGPFQSESTRLSPAGNTAESKLQQVPFQLFNGTVQSAMVAQAVCLCCHLGFQSNGLCRNCQNSTGLSNELYRYYRPLDS